MKNKQNGFASIVSLLIVTAILIIGIQQWSAYKTKQRIIATSESFYNRVLFINEQFHAFAHDKYLSGVGVNTQHIFPFKFSDLEGDYIPPCSDKDNEKGYCFKYNQTPWGEIAEKDYVVVPVPNSISPTHYRAELTLTLPDKNNDALKFDREATIQLFAQLPNITYDDVKNQIVLRIERPDQALAYDSLVKRSGDDSTLLGDWDVGGNHAITNVRDITIANSDGTQRLVSTGLVDILQVRNGDTIYKPACPKGLEPTLTLNVADTYINSLYTHVGSTKPYIEKETSSSWTIKLEIAAIENKTGEKKTIKDGNVTAFVQCVHGD